MKRIVCLSLIRLVAQYLAGARRPDWNTGIAGVGAVFTVGLALLLIPTHGARGAGVAMSIANILSLLVSVVAFLRVSGLRARELLVFRSSDWAPLWRVLGIDPMRNGSE